MMKGKFIVLDGIDGVGTTSHVNALANWLETKDYPVSSTQEPTHQQIGTLIQNLIKRDVTAPAVDALLFAADRLAHLEKVIKPALTKGIIVISDRYVEASIAYQAAAGVNKEWILELNKFIEIPDLTIILDIDPEVGLKRKKNLSDKFEKVDFLRKVRAIYLRRANSQGYPVVNTDRPFHQVTADLRKLVQGIL